MPNVFALCFWYAPFYSGLPLSCAFSHRQEYFWNMVTCIVVFIVLPNFVGFFTLLAALAGAFYLWKQGNRFFRHLTQNALALIAAYALFLIICIPVFPDYVSRVFSRLGGDLMQRTPNASLKLIWYLCLFSSLAAAALELLEQGTLTSNWIFIVKTSILYFPVKIPCQMLLPERKHHLCLSMDMA